MLTKWSRRIIVIVAMSEKEMKIIKLHRQELIDFSGISNCTANERIAVGWKREYRAATLPWTTRLVWSVSKAENSWSWVRKRERVVSETKNYIYLLVQHMNAYDNTITIIKFSRVMKQSAN